ncbi:MAG: gliding motility-associated ABC transporter permease subunit GldF [Bacteroidia bacterium]|nr:gliding motility-associated ABC transporter permease subunit GldF [Bacteroidia bacterium]
MINIFRKEINSFLSSLIGYVVIGVFLILTGLFVWVFPETNVMDYGYANIDPLFITAPWVLMFLAPAITMKLFSEEKKTGTLEILTTKPITDLQIILGKYLAALCLIVFAIFPTLIYFYSVYNLGFEPGNIDTGAAWGSYIGLIFLGAAFASIGILASTLSENQIVAFILAVFLCFVLYSGFDSLGSISSFSKLGWFIQVIGINSHYTSISRGVVDSKDVIYFLSFISLFLLLTNSVLSRRRWG